MTQRPIAIIILALAASVTAQDLPADEVAVEEVPDTVNIVEPWSDRLIRLDYSGPQPGQLRLIMDGWHHSDLVATVDNPFIPTDIAIGALKLDGSLGVPIMMLVIPSATAPAWRDTLMPYSGENDMPSYTIVPMLDIPRHNQTWFHWDQGDFQLTEIELGLSTQIDEERNFTFAGRGFKHPGTQALYGPSVKNWGGNSLQNYILDYRHYIGNHATLNYTTMYMKDQTGQPYILTSGPDSGSAVSDYRHAELSGQGVLYHHNSGNMDLKLQLNNMYHKLTTIDGPADTLYMSRESNSMWYGVDVGYTLSDSWQLLADWQLKSRIITDDELGIESWYSNLSSVAVRHIRGKMIIRAGLALANGKMAPIARVSMPLMGGEVTAYTLARHFMELPHMNRRNDTTATWVDDIFSLQRSGVTYAFQGQKIGGGAAVNQISTSDGRSAITTSVHAKWNLLADALYLDASYSGVFTDDEAFSTRGNGFARAVLLLPLKERRARPYASAAFHFASNEFAYWMDPRYADRATYLGTAPTFSTEAWVTFELGLKATGFELRYRVENATMIAVDNSPGIYYPTNRLQHFSVTWRFLPR